MSNFHQQFLSVAERFLQTVVIVDDEPRIGPQQPAVGVLQTPNRRTVSEVREEQADQEMTSRHSLDAGILAESFAKRGLICGVIAPGTGNNLIEDAASAVKRADIVVLDWQIHRDNGRQALSLLKKIIDDDDDERLRLIAIYTGEKNIDRIGNVIRAKLKEGGRDFRPQDDRKVTLSRGYCRIEVYAKSGTQLRSELRDRSIAETKIAASLIADFANMTGGLLPSIALTSLTAVRENAHKVLDRFQADLDPAFLAHRACLHSPQDAEQHMVTQLASELHGIMDDVVAEESPASMEAIEHWLQDRAVNNSKFVFGTNKEMSIQQTVDLLREGLDRRHEPLKKTRDFNILSRGFADSNINAEELDRRLAWMMNFRTVFDAPIRVLQLGTVVRQEVSSGNRKFFLCLRPRCDSVRLSVDKTVSFLLLPMIEPPQAKTIQLVLRTNGPEHTFPRVSVSTRMTQWQLIKFLPDKKRGSVVAKRDGRGFYFTSSGRVRFEWLGELKAEFAQRIAQHFAAGVSRVAVNNSEWLRRSEH